MLDHAATSPESTTSAAEHRERVAWIAFAVGVILAVGWPAAAIINWSNIVHSDVRLGFLVGDLGLVVPLSFATWYGFRHAAWWGPMIFVLLAGAGAYDIVVFGIFLIQVKAFSVPGIVYGVLGVAIIIGIGIFTRWEIEQDKHLFTGPDRG